MSNPAFPHLLKIGKSAQDPTKYRAKELYQTGVPQPMKVEYSALVEDEDLHERIVHQRFHASRPNKGREFFELDVPTAIKGIRELAAERSPIRIEDVYYNSDDEWEDELLDQNTGDEEHETVIAEPKKETSLKTIFRSLFKVIFIVIAFNLTMLVAVMLIPPQGVMILLSIMPIPLIIGLNIYRKRSGPEKRYTIYLLWYLFFTFVYHLAFGGIGAETFFTKIELLWIVPYMAAFCWFLCWIAIRFGAWTKRFF